MNAFQKLIQKIRYGLFFQFLRDKLLKFGIVITPFYWVREDLADVPKIEFKENLEDFRFVPLTADDMKSIDAIQGADGRRSTEETLVQRFKDGKECLGAKYQGKLAAFSWYNLKECHYDFYKQPMEKNEAYLFDLHTLKEFRGKNLAPYLRIKTYEYLKDKGIDTFYSVSEFFNKPSIRFKKKLNAKFVKLYLYIKIRKLYEKIWLLRQYKT